MIPIFQCDLCKHYYNDSSGSCDAFPEGTPDEIRMNEFDHTQPYPGDHGIRFSPSSDWDDAATEQREIFHPPPPDPEDEGKLERN